MENWLRGADPFGQKNKSSYPIIQKVDNINIFVQLLMEINRKQLRTE